MPLPLFKLGALLAKQISKPLSKILKEKAKQSESFKNYLIIPSANLYHNIDLTLRMRVLGLGSPDKVPPLTEKAAIELGGDILSEFFVFGTAVALLLIEYIRQANNAVKKETALVEKVESLEKEQSELITKLEKTNKRMTEMNEFLADQRTKMEDLNAKYNKLDARRNLKFASQSIQTGGSVVVGKVMYARNSNINPASDVTNSILYQVASMAVDQLKNIAQVPLLKIENDPEPVAPIVPLPVPASKTNNSNTKTTLKPAAKQAASSKLNDKQSIGTLKK